MTLQQHNPPHPGALIQRTYIEPFEEITGNKVADQLGGSAESWLTLQEHYDLFKARQSVDTKHLQRIDFTQVA